MADTNRSIGVVGNLLYILWNPTFSLEFYATVEFDLECDAVRAEFLLIVGREHLSEPRPFPFWMCRGMVQ